MIEINNIYNINCMDGMNQIGYKKVKAVITDPPYGISYLSNHYKNGNPFNEIVGDIKFDSSFIKSFDYCLQDNSVMFIFCDLEKSWLQIKQELGEYYKSTLVWVKNNWTAGDLVSDFGNQYELIVYGLKGKIELNHRFPHVLQFDRVPATALLHPTQKPLALIERLIEATTNIGDLVVDPFAGSGTTLVACKKLNRKFIGFEIDKQHFETTKKGLQKHSHQTKTSEVFLSDCIKSSL